jgi:uncharacterized protein (TIGR02147 family)
VAQSIYDYSDYKRFVLDLIETSPQQGRGVRRKLAEFIGCQVAYVSHVLAADRDFSLEQAEAASRFFSLRDDETEFFLLLVEHHKAATPDLKKHLSKRLSSKIADYREIKKRIRISGQISELDQAVYYSSWHYQAVHSALALPELRSPSSIAKRFGFSVERTNQILTFLLERGLITETRGQYQTSDKQIHLPRTSPLISKLHSNWRSQTLQSLMDMKPDDFHYSGLVTLSVEDMKRVREIILNALESSVEVIRPSKEEKVCVLTMDFYEL